MREILFRGKCIDERGSIGEWLYGYYFFSESVYGAMHAMVTPSTNSEKAIHTLEVDPDTVGQYTGLRDKNGTMVFEGDVIEWCNEHHEQEIDTVRYEDGRYLPFDRISIRDGKLCDSAQIFRNTWDETKYTEGGVR